MKSILGIVTLALSITTAATAHDHRKAVEVNSGEKVGQMTSNMIYVSNFGVPLIAKAKPAPVVKAPAPVVAPAPVAKVQEPILAPTVQFGFDSATLSERAKTELQALAQQIKDLDQKTVSVLISSLDNQH